MMGTVTINTKPPPPETVVFLIKKTALHIFVLYLAWSIFESVLPVIRVMLITV